jgi:tRNA1(Val) A37 N6-methylase TrmN6
MTLLPPETDLELSRDTLFDGRLSFLQPTRGYRVNVDSLLLADFASERVRGGRVLDLGAGVGIVSLALCFRGIGSSFTLLDRDPTLLAIASRNLGALTAAHAVHKADLDPSGLPASLRRSADLVVCNPPFYDPRHHRPAADAALKQARLGSLQPFVRAAAEALHGPKSRAIFVYPARGLADVFEAAFRARLVPKRIRFVHPRAEAPARVVLTELRRAKPGGLEVAPALLEWGADGKRTAELAAIIGGRAVDRT